MLRQVGRLRVSRTENNVKVDITCYKDDKNKEKKTLEFDLEESTLTLKDFLDIVKKMFPGKRKKDLFFEADDNNLVIGDIDWKEVAEEEAKKEGQK